MENDQNHSEMLESIPKKTLAHHHILLKIIIAQEREIVLKWFCLLYNLTITANYCLLLIMLSLERNTDENLGYFGP